MCCFILVGVSLVAMLVSEMLNQLLSMKTIKVFGNSLSSSGGTNPLAAGNAGGGEASEPIGNAGNDEEEDDENEGSRFGPFLVSIPPYAVSVVIGTLFFHLYPGEGKTLWEGLYMAT